MGKHGKHHHHEHEKAQEIEFVGFTKPPERTGWDSFKFSIWDSQRNAFLGRTASSWVKLVTFYTIFFSCLAATWSLFLYIFLQTLPLHEPKWTLSQSIIGTNPGISFRPSPPDKDIDSTLIHFTDGQNGNWDYWVTGLNKIVDEWQADNQGVKYVDCSQKVPSRKEMCKFDPSTMAPECTKEAKFGYDLGRPCVLLKLNKIIGWEPPTYQKLDEIPDDMPQYLQEEIKSKYSNSSGELTKSMIWISCEGENAADKENIGDLSITPSPGIPSYFFPYANQKGYQVPMVAVQFMRPEPGVLITVECKTWFRGVVHNRRDRIGTVRFEMLIDS